jgi:hypothetical protein
MGALIVVSVVLLIGLFFLLRSPAAHSREGSHVAPTEALALREAVLAKLQDRLVGWNFEPLGDDPLEIIAVEAASERRQVWNLSQLADVWLPLRAKGLHDQAEGVVEDLVLGSTGTAESHEQGDVALIRSALALKLVKPGQQPRLAYTRPAGPLLAVLVLRSPAGAETVTAGDLEEWALTEAEAFQLAHANLVEEVADGLGFETIGSTALPIAFLVAPGDPLAASYALVPKLAEEVRRRFKGRDAKLYLSVDALVAGGTAIDHDAEKALLPEPIALDGLAWTTVPVQSAVPVQPTVPERA